MVGNILHSYQPFHCQLINPHLWKLALYLYTMCLDYFPLLRIVVNLNVPFSSYQLWWPAVRILRNQDVNVWNTKLLFPSTICLLSLSPFLPLYSLPCFLPSFLISFLPFHKDVMVLSKNCGLYRSSSTLFCKNEEVMFRTIYWQPSKTWPCG